MEENKPVITVEAYSHKDFKNGFVVANDPYNVGEVVTNQSRRKAFIECPFVIDEDFAMLILARVDGVAAGRIMAFPTLFKAGEEILHSNGGSSLLVVEKYRRYDIAIELLTHTANRNRTFAGFGADFSQDGINVNKALRRTIFTMDKMMLARNSRFVFENAGLKGGILKAATGIANVFLRPLTYLLDYRTPKRLRQYTVKEVDVVPEWVDDVVLNDGHKYMEVHDHRWLQWCRDNMFNPKPKCANHFYTVEKDGRPMGFFMTTERYEGIESRNISPMLTGSVVEWGSKDEKVLSEFDLVRLAVPTFRKDIDMIQFVTDDKDTIKKAKQHCFIQHGVHYITFRDMTKRFKEAKDQRLWRLRFGYSDSIMN
jgi:hypothetical protein